jgi:hypothetical protein
MLKFQQNCGSVTNLDIYVEQLLQVRVEALAGFHTDFHAQNPPEGSTPAKC